MTVFVGPNSFGPARSIERADEVDLPELDAVVAEDRVRRRHVEEEIGQRELQQIVDAGEFFRFASNRSDDFACLGAVAGRGAGERSPAILRRMRTPGCSHSNTRPGRNYPYIGMGGHLGRHNNRPPSYPNR